jgi:hypothetical protein
VSERIASGWKGLDARTLAEARVTVDESGLVYVPYRRVDGSQWNRRVFASSGRTWWERAGIGDGMVPLGLELLPSTQALRGCALIVAEGESDCLALRSAFRGAVLRSRFEHEADRPYHALGLPGAGMWRSAWARYLRPCAVVYVIGDGDQAGRSMIASVRRDVPWIRSVWLPEGEDARSLLQRDGTQAVADLLACADADARLWAALKIARTIEECEALLRGEAVRID